MVGKIWTSVRVVELFRVCLPLPLDLRLFRLVGAGLGAAEYFPPWACLGLPFCCFGGLELCFAEELECGVVDEGLEYALSRHTWC